MKTNTVSQSLTVTKLHRPSVGRELVFRPRLLERLNQRRGLTLVLSPAGYGKTTLVSSWLETCNQPSAWLSLDEQDDDLTVFLTYLVAAVQTLFPSIGENTLALLGGMTRPPLNAITRTLLNELDAVPQEFILVLDDYQVIRDQSIHDLLTEVLRHPPQALQLVLTTRHDPPLPLAALRARGQVTELRAADLCFTLDEAASLVRDVMGLPVDDRTLAVLATRTEGWAVGLRLSALYLRHKGGSQALASDLNGNNRYVMDYLLTEVLAQLPPDVQDFLIKTSILGRLCGPLCDAVTSVGDREQSELSESSESNGSNAWNEWHGQAYLDWLERADLFLLPLDEEQAWFRYHHSFQQLLEHQLQLRHSAGEITGLHARASAWLARHGYVEEALGHALAAGDTAAAVQIVTQQRCVLMNEEEWQRLDRWVHVFPREVIDQQPELLLSEVWLSLIHHQMAEVPPVLDRVETLIAQLPLDDATVDRLQGEVAARRSTQYYFAGDHTRSMAAARRALEKVPAEWWHLRVQARLFLSGGYQMEGHLAQAYAVLDNSAEPDHGRAFQMRLLGAACFIHWATGDLSGMAEVAAQVLAWRDKSARQLESATWSRYFAGIACYHRNDLATAEEYLTPNVLQPYQAHALCFLHSAAALALTYQAQGQPDKARQVVEVMVSYSLGMHNAALLSVSKAFEAELALRQGRLAEASRWAAQYELSVNILLPSFYAPSLTLVRVLIAQNTSGSWQRADQVLSQLHEALATTHNTPFLIEVLALQALLHQAEGSEQAALAPLQQAIGLAEHSHFIRLFVDLGSKLEPLLARLAQRGVSPAYVGQIRAAFGGVEEHMVARAPRTTPPDQTRRSILNETLTNREMDVLVLLARRLTNKEIAKILGISENTVRQHNVTLFQKLHVKNRRQAVALARAYGLLPPSGI